MSSKGRAQGCKGATMSSESDLVLLADGIAKLEEELAEAPATEDRTEIEALLELAREPTRWLRRDWKTPLAPRADEAIGVLSICSDLDTPR